MALVGNIKGATGATGAAGSAGATGATGTRGSLWFEGAGTPAAQTGTLATQLAAALDNDMYLDTSNGDVYQHQSGAW